MQATTKTLSPHSESTGQEKSDMPKMIAENIFRDLRSYGLQDKDIVAVSSELLGRLTSEIKTRTSEEQL